MSFPFRQSPQGLRRPIWPRRFTPLPLLAAIVFFAGCRATGPQLIDARTAFRQGDLQTAAETLEQLSQQRGKLRTVSELDLAMVKLAQGRSDEAESDLRLLRDRFDTSTRVGLDDAASLAVDDTKREFQLAGYEQVLLRSMLAITALASDSGDAGAYCLQAQSLANELTAEAKSDSEAKTFSIALAPYLHGTLREATHQNYDDALRSFRLVSAIEPSFLPAAEDIARVGDGVHSRSGHGVVYVIAFVGAGPQLIETVAPTTTQSLQIASTLVRHVSLNENGDDESDNDTIVLPTIAEVKVPQVYVPPTQISAVGVSIGQGPFLGATQPLTDVARLASERLDAEMPWIIGRAVARRALKEASVSAASNMIGLNGNAASIFQFAAANAWAATENADTRCWSMLPREFQVLRAELPVGKHAIGLSPLGPTGQAFSASHQSSVEIVDGRNTYLFVFAPESIVSVVTPAR
ncbi:hypothetical protein [Roseiconus lacunae]|uniref:Secreted protein n=1 Tax=Roseiconus lacunae TaxID=2605694 RepID=A0ABT7PQ44_9BACT|nr:hypothetical protein [Roseiconus lacunae]MCD0462803.1 hypothetical protein [Roseiconus lacunae]MDM4018628.1 hypothetical protein [Roseiconus lacunae]